MGSRRSTPVLPDAAAVVSDDNVAPRNTPCCQFFDSYTSGTRCCRRAPNITASSGTPRGFSNSGDSVAQLVAGVVKCAFGCVAFSGEDGGVAVYDFEDDNVDGEVLRPEGANLSSRGSQKHASLINIRPHFLRELINLARDV